MKDRKTLTDIVAKMLILDKKARIRILHPLGFIVFLLCLPIYISGYFYAFYTKSMGFIFFFEFKDNTADTILDDLSDSVTLW